MTLSRIDVISAFLVGILIIVLVWATPLLSGITSVFQYDHTTSSHATYELTKYIENTSWLLWDESYSSPVAFDSYFFRYFDALLLLLTRNIWLSLKLSRLALCCLSFAFCFNLTYFYFKSSLNALISGLMYIAMPFWAGILNLHLGSAWFYVLLPQSLLSLEKLIRRPSAKHLLNASFWVGVNVFLPTLQGPFIVGIFVFLFAAVRFLLHYSDKLSFIRSCANAASKLILVGIFSVLVGGYYILPYVFDGYPYRFLTAVREGIRQVELFSPRLWQIITTFSYHELHPAGFFAYEDTSLLLKLSYLLVLVVALLAIMKRDQREIVLPLLSISLLSILLAQGTNAEFPDLFLTMRDTIPLFTLLRTPGRLLMFACLGCSLLFGVTVCDWIRSIPSKTVFGLSLLCLLGFQLLLIVESGELMTLFNMQPSGYVEQRYPQLWEVRRSLTEYVPPDRYRIVDLTIPVEGAPSNGNLYSVGWRSFFNQYEIINRFMKYDYLSDRLGELGIGAVILSKNQGAHISHTQFTADVRQVLQSDLNFELVFEDQVEIWRNTQALPRIYEATPILDFCGPVSLNAISDLEEEGDIPNVLIDPHTLPQEVSLNVLDEYPYWLALERTALNDMIAISHPKWVLDLSEFQVSSFHYDYSYQGPTTRDFLIDNPFFINSVDQQSPIISGELANISSPINYEVNQEGDYYLAFRVMSLTEGNNIQLEIDGLNVLERSLSASTWQWIEEEVHLDAVTHQFNLTGRELLLVDSMMIVPITQYYQSAARWESLLEASAIDRWNVKVGDDRFVTVVLYEGHPTPNWIFVVNTETFSPHWKAHLISDSNAVKAIEDSGSIRTNYFVNGFFLRNSQIGATGIEIYYACSDARKIGITLTVLFLLICFLVNGLACLRDSRYPNKNSEQKMTNSVSSVLYLSLVLSLLFSIAWKTLTVVPDIPRPLFDWQVPDTHYLEEVYHLFGKSSILHY